MPRPRPRTVATYGVLLAWTLWIGYPLYWLFIGPFKPWHYLCRHPMTRSYRRTLARTPWAGFPLEDRTLRYAALRLMPQRWLPTTYYRLRKFSK